MRARIHTTSKGECNKCVHIITTTTVALTVAKSGVTLNRDSHPMHCRTQRKVAKRQRSKAERESDAGSKGSKKCKGQIGRPVW